MLDIVASYHRIQFHKTFMIQTQVNGKKRHFVSIYVRLTVISAIKFVLLK